MIILRTTQKVRDQPLKRTGQPFMTHQCIALTLLMAACGSAPDAPAVAMPKMDTMGGVVMVRNGPTGLWRESEQWQLVEEFRVGSVWDSADEVVTAPRNNSVALGPNGQIFVLEYRAARVLVFSGDGGAWRRTGPSGLRQPVGFA